MHAVAAAVVVMGVAVAVVVALGGAPEDLAAVVVRVAGAAMAAADQADQVAAPGDPAARLDVKTGFFRQIMLFAHVLYR